MTTEEKAKVKAYDEAIKRARDLYNQGLINPPLEYIFPELNEDEKAKKEICDFICWAIDRGCITMEQREKVDSWLAWIEKQENKDKLIKELGEYKVKYTQEVIENELEQQKLYGNSVENERIKKEIINAIHELASIKNEKIDSKWLAWLEK